MTTLKNLIVEKISTLNESYRDIDDIIDDLENAINELANPEFPDKVKQIYHDMQSSIDFAFDYMDSEKTFLRYLRELEEYGFGDYEDEDERKEIENLVYLAKSYSAELVEMYQASKKDFSKLQKLFKDFKSQVNNILND